MEKVKVKLSVADSMPKKILLAEDHPLMRRSIRTICDYSEANELYEVGTCRELLQELKKGKYTHLILDLTLADGTALEVMDDIFHRYCDLKVLVYSSWPANLYGPSFKQQYGFEYVSKAEPAPDTIRQFTEFLQNVQPLGSRHTKFVKTPFSILTQREMQILHYLLRGWGAQEVGDKLNISPATVRVQKKIILKKTKVQNLIELKGLARLHDISD